MHIGVGKALGLFAIEPEVEDFYLLFKKKIFRFGFLKTRFQIIGGNDLVCSDGTDAKSAFSKSRL
jgi:hypothetical protein